MAGDAPRSVDISLSEGVTIEWRDGHVSHFGIRYLRQHCPCASCSGKHGPAPPAAAAKPSALPIFTPTGSTLIGAQRVGNYALLFTFSDRHSTGIYTWQYLRSICSCPQCSPAPPGAPPR
ncbi:MAG: gamma-butyrobetaine hydroxylase-like domain-containing protein [Terriglobales bacterium]